MNLLISALILLSLYIPADLSASCWEDYPWGKSEKTTVEQDWIKTIVMSWLTSYVEIQNIDGVQIKTQYIFLNSYLAQIARTIHSTAYSLKQQADLLWGPCYNTLGPSEVAEYLNTSNWIREDLNTWAVAGRKGNLLWISAGYIPARSILLDTIGEAKLQLIY